MLGPSVNDSLERGLLLENALGFFAVVPEIRLMGQMVQLIEALLLALDVKDASARDRVALQGG